MEDDLNGAGAEEEVKLPPKQSGISLSSLGSNGSIDPTPPVIGRAVDSEPPEVTDERLAASVAYVEYLQGLQKEDRNANRRLQIQKLQQANAFGRKCQA